MAAVSSAAYARGSGHPDGGLTGGGDVDAGAAPAGVGIRPGARLGLSLDGQPTEM